MTVGSPPSLSFRPERSGVEKSHSETGQATLWREISGLRVSIKDKTFTLRSEYIDEKDGIFNDKGTYTLDGNVLTARQEGGDITYYKVEEGQLKMLDQQKQPVTGDLAKFYILKQTKKF